MDKNEISIKDTYRVQYISRINKVIDYIEQNLESSLELQTLAQVASFSPFHFHRVFVSVKGETLNLYIRRRRLEKAASYLITSNYTINDIATKCGFNSSASFARSFRDHFNMSASEFRNGGYNEYVKTLEKSSPVTGKHFGKVEEIRDNLLNEKKKLYQKVEMRYFEDITVAYCRHVGEFSGIGSAFEKLFRWAGPRGLLEVPDSKVITYYHDDPKVTRIDNLQQSACISIEPSVRVDGEIGKMVIQGGRYACARFEIDNHEFTEAWTSFYVGWLPESGYECDDKPPFELYYNNYKEHPENKFILDICIPVRPVKIL